MLSYGSIRVNETFSMYVNWHLNASEQMTIDNKCNSFWMVVHIVKKLCNDNKYISTYSFNHKLHS